jgi:hypothetical protein
VQLEGLGRGRRGSVVVPLLLLSPINSGCVLANVSSCGMYDDLRHSFCVADPTLVRNGFVCALKSPLERFLCLPCALHPVRL